MQCGHSSELQDSRNCGVGDQGLDASTYDLTTDAARDFKLSHHNMGKQGFLVSQKVHVGTWCILRAQRGSHIPTLRPKYTPHSYMDLLDNKKLHLNSNPVNCRLQCL